MKRMLAVMLVLVLAAFLGCGSGQKEDRQDSRLQQKQAEREKGLRVREIEPLVFVDPVDRREVSDLSVELSYRYEGVDYFFNSRENMERFKQDPEKYAGK